MNGHDPFSRTENGLICSSSVLLFDVSGPVIVLSHVLFSSFYCPTLNQEGNPVLPLYFLRVKQMRVNYHHGT